MQASESRLVAEEVSNREHGRLWMVDNPAQQAPNSAVADFQKARLPKATVPTRKVV